MKTESLGVVHHPVLVKSCSSCPFVCSRNDYCLANTYLGLSEFPIWVNRYFIESSIHPDCPLLVDSIVICGDSNNAMEAQS